MSGAKKTIGLSELEFKILLSACHITSLVCFEKEDGAVSQEDYNRAVSGMFQRKLLVTSEGKEELSLAGEIKSLMDGIKNRTSAVLLRDTTGKNPSYIIYAGKEEAVIATPGVRKSEYIRMTMLPKKELILWINDAEILPPVFVPGDLRGENNWHDSCESEDSVFEAFFYEIEEQEAALTWQIVPEHIGYELRRNVDGRWQSIIYGKEEFESAMLCFIEEGKNGFS